MKTLVIVDLQHAIEVPSRLIERIERYAQDFDLRVFTRFVNRPGSIFRTKLKQSCCAPGSRDTELRIAPQRGDLVLTKPGYGLKPTDVRKLRERGVKKAMVCGVDTDACVLGVMFSLFDAGIDCHAKEDLCWSSSGLQRPALQIIRQQFEPGG